MFIPFKNLHFSQSSSSETEEEDIKPAPAQIDQAQEEQSELSLTDQPEPQPNISNLFTNMVKNEVRLLYDNTVILKVEILVNVWYLFSGQRND